MRPLPMMTQLFATLAIAAASLAAQGQTWIVDAAAGAGSQFTDIPPALQVAQDGDTILVRSGTYNGGSITRGISIIADTGATVSVVVTSGTVFSRGIGLEVDGLPAGKTVVLEGLRPAILSTTLFGSFVRLANCSGRVHLDNLSGSLAGPGVGLTGIEVIDCAHVSIHRCALRSGVPVWVTRSTALISNSDFLGRHALGGFRTSTVSQAALYTADSQVTIAHSKLQGGNGNAFAIPLAPPPAIVPTNGALTIAGGAQAVVSAGVLMSSGSGIPAIGGSGATIEIDPRVTLTPVNGAPAVAIGHTATVARVPSISAAAGGPGGALVIDLLATAGDLAEVYISLPFGPLASPIPGSGDIWINFAAMLNLGRTQVPTSEQLQVTIPLPPVASIRGVPLTIQALTASATTGFRFSTPATAVLN